MTAWEAEGQEVREVPVFIISLGPREVTRGRALSAGLLSRDILDHHLHREELRSVRTSLWLKMGSGVKVGCVFGWCL